MQADGNLWAMPSLVQRSGLEYICSDQVPTQNVCHRSDVDRQWGTFQAPPRVIAQRDPMFASPLQTHTITGVAFFS